MTRKAKPVSLFIAGKALIRWRGKVLIVRESSAYKVGTNPGRWDVVGGRITPGEPFQRSVKREIREEVGLSVALGQPFFVNESWPVIKGKQWQIVRVFYTAIARSGRVQLSPDHDAWQWIDPRQFRRYRIIGNLVPIFTAYLKL